ncbi:MAG: hypothetical protein KOO60_13735 [Gemmatimonadales bacterium]|nr:hypothetical protein [Gemmatimonadales bacterium]
MVIGATSTISSGKRRFGCVTFSLFLAWFYCVTLSGCSPGGPDGEPTPSSSSSGITPGGTAVIALAGDPDVLNSLIRGSSYAGVVLAELQDALAELGEDLEWEPRIASGWELAADRLSITYQLKPWVWSDGEPLTARDVVSSFQLIRDERVASHLRGFHEAVKEVVALDPSTVRYSFSYPIADPVVRTIHPLLPAHVTDLLDPGEIRKWSLNRQPVSSGDFRLVGWDHNQSLVLVRNELYPGPAPNLDRVVFRIIPEESSRVLALETGEVDLVDGLPPVTAKRLTLGNQVRVVETSGRQFYYVVWNLKNPVFRDAVTRQALSLAMDRQRMIDTLMLGYASPAASCIPPAMWNHHPSLVADPCDPKRARLLLASVGWADTDGDGILDRDGHPLRFTVLTKHGDPVRENGLVILRENLQAVGAELVPQVLEHATGLDRLREGNFDAYFGRFNANLYGDPTGLVHSKSTDRFNSGHYANARVDSLIELGMSLVEHPDALPVWLELQEELTRDPAAAYLFYPRRLVGVSRRLQDVRPHLMSPVNNLSEWWVAPQDRKYRSEQSGK